MDWQKPEDSFHCLPGLPRALAPAAIIVIYFVGGIFKYVNVISVLLCCLCEKSF